MSNARFSITPARAVFDKRITHAIHRTLCALGTHGDRNGWCYPSLGRLGALLGKSKQAVSRDIQKLKELGYLEIYPQYKKDGGRESNKYRIILDFSPDFNSTPSTPEVDTPSTPEVDTPSTSGVDVNDPINDPINALKPKLSFTTIRTPKEIERIPEIQVFKQITGYTPPANKVDRILNMMDESPDKLSLLHLMHECYERWTDLGFKSKNLDWLFGWVANGGVPEKYQLGTKEKTASSASETVDLSALFAAQSGD